MVDIEWIIHSSRLHPKYEKKIHSYPKVGVVNGLAVYGANTGMLLEVEVTAQKVEKDGELIITGIVEEESVGGSGKSIRRKSMVRNSIENVMTVLRNNGMITNEYSIHINFPSGIPV